MAAKRKVRQILSSRARVSLSDRQTQVLVDILSGMDIAEIAIHRKMTKSNVSHVKSRLKQIFKAKSTIHLMVLAILEWRFYELVVNNAKNHVSSEISEKEVEIIKHVLNGSINKEIAEPTNITLRTIEFHRYEFNKKCKVSSNKDLINACLQNGILKVLPFEFYLSRSYENSILSFSRAYKYYHFDEYSGVTNEFGFIYFDYQNRFITLDSNESGLYTYFQVNPLIFSYTLSGIPTAIIAHISELSERFLESRQNNIGAAVKRRGGYLNFYSLLKELNFYQPVITRLDLPQFSRLSILIFLEGIEKCLTDETKVSVTSFDLETIKDQEEILYKEFNCDSPLTLIAQAIHLNLFKL
ncbi:MAG: LuxR C-terminal-related transcriptional regulator [bacterium]|nr:LuxR C-terminal-related transcriptional regulator [bacterium]